MIKEQIICPAVSVNGAVVGGVTHADCISQIGKLLNKAVDNNENVIYGFLTSCNRFIDEENLSLFLFKNLIAVSEWMDGVELQKQAIRKVIGESAFNMPVGPSIYNWARLNKLKNTSITRIVNVLKSADIDTVGTLVYYSKKDLLRFPGIGEKGIYLIFKWLKEEYNWG